MSESEGIQTIVSPSGDGNNDGTEIDKHDTDQSLQQAQESHRGWGMAEQFCKKHNQL